MALQNGKIKINNITGYQTKMVANLSKIIGRVQGTSA
jgi:hypothetical protein